MDIGASHAAGKFVLDKVVGWADGVIVCPRGLESAWAQTRAHPTFVDFKNNFCENKLALPLTTLHDTNPLGLYYHAYEEQ